MIAKLCFITRSRRAEHCFPFCPDTRAVNVFQTKMWSSALCSIFTIQYSLLEPRTKDLHFKKFLLKNTWDKYVKQKFFFSIKEKQREAIHPYLGSNRTPLVQTNPTNQPTRVQKTHICVCICNCIVFYCIFICIWICVIEVCNPRLAWSHGTFPAPRPKLITQSDKFCYKTRYLYFTEPKKYTS